MRSEVRRAAPFSQGYQAGRRIEEIPCPIEMWVQLVDDKKPHLVSLVVVFFSFAFFGMLIWCMSGSIDEKSRGELVNERRAKREIL